MKECYLFVCSGCLWNKVNRTATKAWAYPEVWWLIMAWPWAPGLGVLLGSSPAPLWGVLQGLWKKGAILEQGLVSLCFLCLLGGSTGLFAVICLVLCCREDVRLGLEACPCWKNCGADRVRTRVPLVVIHVYNFFLKSKCLMGLWEESVCYCLHEVWFFFGLLGPELLDSALILVDSGLYL